jgi:hypothetical protein
MVINLFLTSNLSLRLLIMSYKSVYHQIQEPIISANKTKIPMDFIPPFVNSIEYILKDDTTAY